MQHHFGLARGHGGFLLYGFSYIVTYNDTMQLTSRLASLAEVQADWLVVGILEQDDFKGAVAGLDAKLGGALARLLARGDITGKPRELTPILDTHGITATPVLAVGLG